MIYTTIILLTIVSFESLACDQTEYDKIYMALSQRVIASQASQKDLDDRYYGVEELRKLCNNQISTWEKITEDKK